MAQLTFRVSGDDKILRKLKFISQTTSNLKPAFKDVGNFLVSSYEKNVDEKGKKLDSSWKPRLWNYPHPILNKTGRLRSGFKVSRITKIELEVSNPVEYAKYHQFGTRDHGPVTARALVFQGPNGQMIFTKKVRGLPPRPLVGLGRILIQDVIEIFNRHLNGAIKR